MRRAFLAAAILGAACSGGPDRPFTVGVLEPVPARVAAEARRLGLAVLARAPAGAAVESAAASGQAGAAHGKQRISLESPVRRSFRSAAHGEQRISLESPVRRSFRSAAPMADFGRLRFLAARAIVSGSAGVFFRLPGTPAGTDILDYPEEWQAVVRVAREALAARPILEKSVPAPAPFVVPDGIAVRAWTLAGRRYALLVNISGAPEPLDEGVLAPWRALFAVRSDARELLAPCGRRRCLPAEGVLWLEGRLLENQHG